MSSFLIIKNNLKKFFKCFTHGLKCKRQKLSLFSWVYQILISKLHYSAQFCVSLAYALLVYFNIVLNSYYVIYSFIFLMTVDVCKHMYYSILLLHFGTPAYLFFTWSVTFFRPETIVDFFFLFAIWLCYFTKW